MTAFTRTRRHKDVAAKHDNGDSWATCGPCGKRSYHNKRAARAAAKRLEVENARRGRVAARTPGAVMRPYRCPDTGAFHLGHSVPRCRPNLNDPRLSFSPDFSPEPGAA